MSAWGYAIRSDDTVCDIQDSFKNSLKKDKNIAIATEAVHSEYGHMMGDPDDEPLFWLALADMQWTYGDLDAKVLKRVKADFKSEAGMDVWRDDPEFKFEKRRQVLEKFIDKISKRNPKPTKIPKLVIRPPKFAAGDCIAVPLEDGTYGAGFVSVADHSDPEYGANVIAQIEYGKKSAPELSDFEQREYVFIQDRTRVGHVMKINASWLSAATYGWREFKKKFIHVGNVPVEPTDPNDAKPYRDWRSLLHLFTNE